MNLSGKIGAQRKVGNDYQGGSYPFSLDQGRVRGLPESRRKEENGMRVCTETASSN